MFRILIILFSLLSSVNAVETLSSDTVNKLNSATINTLLVFTGQKGLNSGLYHFTSTAVDVDMEIYHLPFLYQFTSTSKLNYFMVGNVGYSKTYLVGDLQQIPEDIQLDYSGKIQTYTGGIGGGVRYKFTDDISLSGGIEFIYSRSGISVKSPEGEVGDAISNFFNSNYSDNLTYKLFALAEYKPIINDYKPYVSLGYKLHETKSEFSVKEIASFGTESSVSTLSLGVETPKLLEFGQDNITLEAYLDGHYLSGTVRDVVNFDTYSSVGGVIYYNTPDEPWWSSRYFFEVSSVQSEGLNGYNIGIGFTLDF